jgi:hypothetical protein
VKIESRRLRALGVFGSQTEGIKGFGFEVMRTFGFDSLKV